MFLRNIRWDILWSCIRPIVKIGIIIMSVLVSFILYTYFWIWLMPVYGFIPFLIGIVLFICGIFLYLCYTDKLMNERYANYLREHEEDDLS